MAVEILKILLTIALVTPLIPITLLVGNYMYYHIDLAATSYSQFYSRPIIGGVLIQAVPKYCTRCTDLICILHCMFIAYAHSCTTSYAVRVNGTVGFISAGHCADFSSDFHIYQPIYLPPICYLRIIPGLPPKIE